MVPRPSILLIGASGYIGTRLNAHLARLKHDVVGLDRVGGDRIWTADYRDLSPTDVSGFHSVIWFAGHSSVQMAAADAPGAIENNVSGLLRLAQMLSPDQRLIYASSAALYSGSVHPGPLVSEEQVGGQFQNAYDLTKFACDTLMSKHTSSFCALRLGTVCGTSPRQRHELLLNSMVRSAVRTGKVHVANQAALRSVLAMDDLLAIVSRMLVVPPPAGFYDLASHSMSIGAFGRAVATQLDASLVEVDGAPTYSFSVDSTKIRAALDMPPPPSLTSMIEQLAIYYDAQLLQPDLV